MSTAVITLEIDTDAARAFRSASIEEQRKLVALFSYFVRIIGKSDTSSLKEIMDEISQNAQKRGLTPEILNSILQDK